MNTTAIKRAMSELRDLPIWDMIDIDVSSFEEVWDAVALARESEEFPDTESTDEWLYKWDPDRVTNKLFFDYNGKTFYIEVPARSNAWDSIPLWDAIALYDELHGTDFYDRLNPDDIWPEYVRPSQYVQVWTWDDVIA